MFCCIYLWYFSSFPVFQLKDLNNSKLIVYESKWFPWSSRINFIPLRILRGSLFHKPVTGQELFLLFLTANWLLCHGEHACSPSLRDPYSKVPNTTVRNPYSSFGAFPSYMILFGTSRLLNFMKSSFLHFYSEFFAYGFFTFVFTTLQLKVFVSNNWWYKSLLMNIWFLT